MKKYILLISLFTILLDLISKDSLRVYCLGYHFKKETYKIRINGDWYYKKMDKGQDAFYFDLALPDSIYDFAPLDIYILRKSRLGFKFKSIKLDVHYRLNMDYCLLRNDFRLKPKYSLRLEWTDKPYGNIPQLPRDYWNKDITLDRVSLKARKK
jgi:hypothetical protein